MPLQLSSSARPFTRKAAPNVPGTLLGVLFLGMIANGLNLMGLNFNTKDMLSGLILVGALAIAVAQKKGR